MADKVETIRDRIQSWAQTNLLSQTPITRDSDAYNQVQTAVQKLLAEPWTNIVIGNDMPPAPPEGTLRGSEEAKTT